MKKLKNLFWLILAVVAAGTVLLPWLFVVLAVFNWTEWGLIIVSACYILGVLFLTGSVLLKNAPDFNAMPVWVKIIVILIVLISILFMRAL